MLTGNEKQLSYMFEYLCSTFLPLSNMILCFQTTFRPPEQTDPTSSVFDMLRQHASLINNSIATVASAVIFYKNEPYKCIGAILLFFYTLLMYRRATHLARRLRDEKLKDNLRALNNFNLSKTPKLIVSTFFSYLFVASETIACLYDRDNYNTEAIHCNDVANSNKTFLWFTALTVYFHLYAFPHLQKDYSTNELLASI